jgi:hypothetical protein
MKIALATVFAAALASAQEVPPPTVPARADSTPPAATSPAPAPAETPKPVLKATAPGTAPEPAAAPAKPLSSHDAAEALTPDELKQAVDLLRDNYIRPDHLSDEALARAGMQGLLDRLGAGARVYAQKPEVPSQESPFHHELLKAGVAYVRLGALNMENLSALDKALNDQAANPPGALVLDLRATPPNTDFEFAAEVCRRFCPRGRILFSIKRPKVNDEEILTSRDEPRWRGLLVVLVDGDTAGSAEVVAAVLHTHLRAYVVGQRTQGEAAQFEDLRLSGGRMLRIAVGEVSLPDSTPVFPGGLQPDLPVGVPQEQTDAALAAELTGGVASIVEDKERPRLNEAALVAGTNPELDAMREYQKLREKGQESKPQVRDVTLQRALDYVASVSVYEAAQAKRRP